MIYGDHPSAARRQRRRRKSPGNYHAIDQTAKEPVELPHYFVKALLERQKSRDQANVHRVNQLLQFQKTKNTSGVEKMLRKARRSLDFSTHRLLELQNMYFVLASS